MITIPLATFRDLSGIRVNEEYVVTSIDLAELHANNKTVYKRPGYSKPSRFDLPKVFRVLGKEQDVDLYIMDRRYGIEGELQCVIYKSLSRVKTRSGMKRVSVTVWND